VTINEAGTRKIYRFDEVDWEVPLSPGTDEAEARAAADKGAGRKRLAQGDSGFYTQIVRIPANFEAPVHSHDHAEVFMVVEGSCVFDGQPMSKHDMTVVASNQPYSFVAGPEGLQFLIVRNGAAAYADKG
jgi:mannose-6-phosphate isomerase-like protein (cupin superfamily)